MRVAGLRVGLRPPTAATAAAVTTAPAQAAADKRSGAAPPPLDAAHPAFPAGARPVWPLRVATGSSNAAQRPLYPASEAECAGSKRRLPTEPGASKGLPFDLPRESLEDAGRPAKRFKASVVHNALSTRSSGQASAAPSTANPPQKVFANPPPAVAKDVGWIDLDQGEVDDPLMVSEYAPEIYAHMRRLELPTMPNPLYMDMQDELTWAERNKLVDWLISVHHKFSLVPETLFLAVNITDRFLSLRHVALSRLQLIGVAALFLAAKYEEVLVPSVENLVYICNQAATTQEILAAEQYILRTLEFNLSYPNPMGFLRRISKAENYDIQTRTVAKYLMEFGTVDHRILPHPPSVLAAASLWLAREVLQRGDWTPTLIHYSGYTVCELMGTAELILDNVLRPTELMHRNLFRKYASKQFMQASTYVQCWGKLLHPQAVQAYRQVAPAYVERLNEECKRYGSVQTAQGKAKQLRSMTFALLVQHEKVTVNLFKKHCLARPSPRDMLRVYGFDEALTHVGGVLAVIRAQVEGSFSTRPFAKHVPKFSTSFCDQTSPSHQGCATHEIGSGELPLHTVQPKILPEVQAMLDLVYNSAKSGP